MTPEMPCMDCKKETMETDYYMLKDEVWLEAVPQEDGCGTYFLCIECCQKRLKRKLKKNEFKNIEMNKEVLKKHDDYNSKQQT